MSLTSFMTDDILFFPSFFPLFFAIFTLKNTLFFLFSILSQNNDRSGRTRNTAKTHQKIIGVHPSEFGVRLFSKSR